MCFVSADGLHKIAFTKPTYCNFNGEFWVAGNVRYWASMLSREYGSMQNAEGKMRKIDKISTKICFIFVEIIYSFSFVFPLFKNCTGM